MSFSFGYAAVGVSDILAECCVGWSTHNSNAILYYMCKRGKIQVSVILVASNTRFSYNKIIVISTRMENFGIFLIFTIPNIICNLLDIAMRAFSMRLVTSLIALPKIHGMVYIIHMFPCDYSASVSAS